MNVPNGLGQWIFIIGLVISVLAGLSNISWMPTLLFVLGLIVGFLNVGEKETTPFLIAVIALAIIGVAGIKAVSGGVLGEVTPDIAQIIDSFISFVSAAGLVVALKEVLSGASPNKNEKGKEK